MNTVITNKMVETFGNSLRKLAGLEPASYADMLETTPKVVEHIRLHLEAVAPMILEAAAKVAYPDPLYMAGNDRDENGNLPPGSPYDRGRYDAAKDVRALKDPHP
jgi:hypothetical protein